MPLPKEISRILDLSQQQVRGMKKLERQKLGQQASNLSVAGTQSYFLENKKMTACDFQDRSDAQEVNTRIRAVQREMDEDGRNTQSNSSARPKVIDRVRGAWISGKRTR